MSLVTVQLVILPWPDFSRVPLAQGGKSGFSLSVDFKLSSDYSPQGDQPAHSSAPPQDMPPPKPAPASARPQPTAHSTSLLKSLLNGSTLSSVVDLCKYKSEVGNLGSIDTELQRLQDDLPVRPSKQSEEDMEVVPELLSKAPMEGLVDK